MLVTSPAQLVASLGDVATQAGGYVAGVENKDEGGVPVTSIKLKLPPDRYEPAMRQIRALAVEVTSEKATTQDVTEEFSDVQTQLASLEATHAQLLELLKRANSIEEILKIQEKVSQTKAQIDRLKGRETFLQRSSELATITVNAKPAEEVLARNFSALRTSLRRAEAQRAQTLKAIQTARTPEEEATLRDRLGEVTLEVDRLNARLADVQAKAQTAQITLPAAPPDDPIDLDRDDRPGAVEGVHAAQGRQATRRSRGRAADSRAARHPDGRDALMQAKLRVSTLDTQIKTTGGARSTRWRGAAKPLDRRDQRPGRPARRELLDPPEHDLGAAGRAERGGGRRTRPADRPPGSAVRRPVPAAAPAV